MLLQMGVVGRWRTRYEKLSSIDEKGARPRRGWVTKMNGKLKGLRLSRSRKLNWKAFSIVLSPRRITEMYDDIVNRVMMDDTGPAIVFSGQWGLPVLSQSKLNCRSAMSVHRNQQLACFH